MSRRQLVGAGEIEAALEGGEPLRLVLLHSGRTTQNAALRDRLGAAGIPVRDASEREMERYARTGRPELALGMLGPDPAAALAEVLAQEGALWLLCGVAYPGNAGFAIRAAEVSGADGVIVDAKFDHDARQRTLRAAMRADRFLPVFFDAGPPEVLMEEASAAGRRVVAVEDVGRSAPWESDLRGPLLFVLGGEAASLPPVLIERADASVRIPMAGFVPSYNLQAAMAAVMAERLRQTLHPRT